MTAGARSHTGYFAAEPDLGPELVRTHRNYTGCSFQQPENWAQKQLEDVSCMCIILNDANAPNLAA